MKPPLYSKGHVLFVTSAFPPTPGGSCVLNQNFLKCFESSSFTVITHDSQLKKIEVSEPFSIKRIVKSFQRLGRFNALAMRLQRPLAKWRIKRIARRQNAKLIIGTYPNLYFLRLASEVALELGVPFVAYLHDTVLEANLGSELEHEARAVQEHVFQYAKMIFVMSDGMKELYRQKYGLETFPLRHTYLESIQRDIKRDRCFSPRRFFWGGAIYDINSSTLSRFSCLLLDGAELELATNTDVDRLRRLGFCFERIRVTFYEKRADYLDAMGKADFLVLALDDAQQTKVNKDEIGTIFPTKTPEYLASGIPILVLCPDEYFLSRFFKRYECGYVLNELNSDSVESLFTFIRENPSDVTRRISNAFGVAESLFDYRVVRDTFLEDISML